MFLIICLLFLLTIPTTYAQYWEVGGGAGISFYHGDLAADFTMQPPGLAAAFNVRRNVDERLSLRMGASFGTISAADFRSENPYNKARNLSFESIIFEGSVAVEFNFLPFHHHSKRSNKKNQFTPFLVAGFGVFYHNPKAEYKGTYYPLQSLGTEGQAPGNEYSLVQPALILGGGFKIDINYYWGIFIEGSTRILFFDYLDDVSGTYADKRLIASHRGSLASAAVGLSDRSGEIGQHIGTPGRQRGDANTNDGYTMFTIGIVYTMHQPSCPAW